MDDLYFLLTFFQFVFGFVFSILTGIGFVAIFAMKRSNLGLVFPLFTIISFVVYWAITRVNIVLHIYENTLASNVSNSLSLLFAIIAGLILLTIRERSANRSFLVGYAIYRMVWPFISFGIPASIFLIPFYWSLQALGYISYILVLIFFTFENRMGCINSEEQAGYHPL